MKLTAVLVLLTLTGVPASAGPWQPFTALAASPDGRFLATGGMAGEVLWWELSTGEVLRKWELAPVPVAGLSFGSDSVSLAIVLTDGRAFLWGGEGTGPKDLVLSGSPWAALAATAVRWKQAGSPMEGTEASREGVLARGGPDGMISVTGAPVGMVTWPAHGSAVTGLAWSPEGLVLTSCSYDGSLAQWDPRTGKLLARL